MRTIEMTKAEVRHFLIQYHGLAHRQGFEGEAGILAFVERVGCIQYDPLRVVGRNADLVLQSRITGYTPAMLDKLLYQDRYLVDGWDKQMAIYHRQDWQRMGRIRERHGAAMLNTLAHRNSLEALKLAETVKDHLREAGPQMARQIDLGSRVEGRGSWGHGKLSSAALDYLFHKGELGINSKKDAHRVYDLIENLLPSDLLAQADPFSEDEAFYRWYCERHVGSVGMLWARNGGGWLCHFLSDKKGREALLKALWEAGRLVAVKVEGVRDLLYVRREDLEASKHSQGIGKPQVLFLAPLDNLLWDRALLEAIFGFSYSWEVYLPKEKRRFGYYVLPVLYGDRFVARFEPEAHRGTALLKIKNWWWEPGVQVTEELKQGVEEALEQFCHYLGAKRVSKESLKKLNG